MNITEERLNRIEARLAKIEAALNVRSDSTTPSEIFRPIPPLKVTRTKSVSSFEKPGSWLGIVATICFVLAAGFIIKLTIDSGWLTPSRQIYLSFLFGVVLILIGLLLRKSDREYASLLPATGVIILYLTVFASRQFYHLISINSGLMQTAIISAICIGLYWRFKLDVYAITAALGAYLSPIILDFATSSVFPLYYFVFCSLAFAIISIWMQSRILTMISAYLAIVITAFIGLDLNQNKLIVVFLALHFFIFSLGTYFHTKHTKQPLTAQEAWSFFPVLLIFYAAEYYFIYLIDAVRAPWISMAFAGFLICLYLSAKNYFPDRTLASRPVILAFATIVAFHSIYIELLPADARAWLFVLIVLGFAALPETKTTNENFSTYKIPLFALGLILIIEYINMCTHLIEGYSTQLFIGEPVNQSNVYWLSVGFASLASLWILFLRQQLHIQQNESHGYFLLAVAHLLAICALYRLTTDVSSLAVSASWLFYAVFVIAFAYWRKDKVMAMSAMIVLSIAAAKALLYDVASAPTVIRILCLLLTGAVLYGAGYLMRKIAEWR